ncbi:class I SAM-dependent methyltransferase [Mucilaginibacter psychrotolerans]|uniref:Class I SAM-dependent methyltransferase n=1 Tax=Mucilaginibacter psychrotolerans TaxID=1524096 RepID=A0A4Y8SD94_9SPHI|nr:class I SAM-dependent methyltransferase [Mucilaginibacter psychrotolerans]TFF36570.1 class I SAM-dependent methyltransferase [Mucilaginibacter psychrotolerans]
MNPYLSEKKLFGDDFTIEEIENWYNLEKEAYANLGSKNAETYVYHYHALNKLHGFNYLKGRHFKNVLGLGAAWGHEFEPIIDQISNLHIIEPSDNLRSDKLGNITPIYTMPQISGTINYPDGYFDLVTSLGTLHHIPNVSYVVAELSRVTKQGGYILIREPVISMGDWTKPREGLTANERGIPLPIFRDILAQHPLQIIHESFCFTMTAFFQRTWVRFSKIPIYKYKSYILLDKFLSNFLLWNLKYHATNKLQRIAPQSVFYVIKKR